MFSQIESFIKNDLKREIKFKGKHLVAIYEPEDSKKYELTISILPENSTMRKRYKNCLSVKIGNKVSKAFFNFSGDFSKDRMLRMNEQLQIQEFENLTTLGLLLNDLEISLKVNGKETREEIFSRIEKSIGLGEVKDYHDIQTTDGRGGKFILTNSCISKGNDIQFKDFLCKKGFNLEKEIAKSGYTLEYHRHKKVLSRVEFIGKIPQKDDLFIIETTLKNQDKSVTIITTKGFVEKIRQEEMVARFINILTIKYAATDEDVSAESILENGGRLDNVRVYV